MCNVHLSLNCESGPQVENRGPLPLYLVALHCTSHSKPRNQNFATLVNRHFVFTIQPLSPLNASLNGEPKLYIYTVAESLVK
jgi:hypothetical protein